MLDNSLCCEIVKYLQARGILQSLILGMNLMIILFLSFFVFCSFILNGKGVQGKNNVSMDCF
jgi:uncharacterized membrane protein